MEEFVKRLLASATAAAVLAVGALSMAPFASAATVWNVPTADITAGSRTITVSNLQITGGVITGGYARVTGHNTNCASSRVSGNSAIFTDAGAFDRAPFESREPQ